MKGTVVLGILLVVLGIFALIYQGFTYTDRDKVIDIGPLEAHTETRKIFPISPILGGTALVGGLVVMVLGARK